jgi:hypothetical protein
MRRRRDDSYRETVDKWHVIGQLLRPRTTSNFVCAAESSSSGHATTYQTLCQP